MIEDNVSIHTSHETKLALAAWPEIQIQFIPKYAWWLRPKGVIETWWKQLRSLALKDRRFENVDELTAALCAALAYWSAHKRPYHWKKKPQKQVLLGGFGVGRAA